MNMRLSNTTLRHTLKYRVMVMVFNATFNHI